MTEENRTVRAAMLKVAYEIIEKVYKDLLNITPRGNNKDEDMLYEFQEVMDKLYRLSERVKGKGV